MVFPENQLSDNCKLVCKSLRLYQGLLHSKLQRKVSLSLPLAVTFLKMFRKAQFKYIKYMWYSNKIH